MKLLVTGGLGFIGSNFIAESLARDEVSEVVNVSNLSFGANIANSKPFNGNPKYRFVEGEINDRSLLSKHLAGSDVVVNFAAQTHVDRSISDPTPFVRSNVDGVLSILETVRRSAPHVKLVQIGTDEVYGDVSRGSASEDSPLKPSSPYAATKAAGDLLCLSYHRTYGTNVVVTRCTNNFGPRQYPEKFIPKAIIRAHLGLKIPLYGDGSQQRDWIHVSDHCRAIWAAIARGKPGGVYNIAGHNLLSNREVLETLLEMMQRPRGLIQRVEDRPGHDTRYSVTDDRAMKELGWKPVREFREALRETVEWYLRNEDWWRPVADERTLSPTPWKTNSTA